jgi:D-alanyl-D-alanine dipeptidase
MNKTYKKMKNHNLLPNCLWLLGMMLVCWSCQGTTSQKDYLAKYKAPVVSSLADYQQIVAQNPDHALVDLRDYLPDASYDLVYATDQNFMGRAVYDRPAAYLRKPAAEALQKVQLALDSLGYGLKIWDAYRPYFVTVQFYEHVLDSTFAASPYTGSKHNRGCAVDVTLIDKTTGQELAMPTPFDEFSERAHIAFMDLPQEVIAHRTLLIETMARYGFAVYADEWWHFDFQNWEQYRLMDLGFGELEKI